MSNHYFISYSNVDAADFASRLYDSLIGGYPRIPAWLDKQCIQPQMDWEVALEKAIADCLGFLYVMTRDSVDEGSTCRQELGRALTFKKAIIPLKLQSDIMPPLRVENRQYIDFSEDFEVGLANLRQHLAWLATLEGKVYLLECRLRDAERELRRTSDSSQRARLESEIQRLNQEITQNKNIAANPEAARQRTTESIERNLERERVPQKSIVPEAVLKFINPPPGTAPDYFQDRHIETQQLGRWLGDPQTRLMLVVGRGGVGKTAMVCRLLKTLEVGRLPDDGGELRVDGIVYLSAAGSYLPNVPTLFSSLGKLLPRDVAQELDALYRDIQGTPGEKMQTLLSYFPPSMRVVVLLDNFEDLIDSEHDGARIMDTELDQVLRTLLQAPAHGLKVIITTRVAPGGLIKEVRPGTFRTLSLDQGLESPFAENILREMDSTGKLGLRDAADAVLSDIRERTRGYPRALEALVATLEADPNTSLDEVLTSAQAALPENLVNVMVGEAFLRLDRSAQQVMQALAIFRKPVPPVAIDFMLQTFQPGIDSSPILARLASMYFVRKEAGRYYLHPVDRDYALSRVPPGEDSDRFEAGDPVFTRVALRSLGANYLTSIRKPRTDWNLLTDLQPLIDEIELRLENNDWDNAAEVLDDIGENYLQQWGYYRLELDLRKRLEGHLTEERQKYLNLYSLGFLYYRLGDNEQALRYLDRALQLVRELEDRHEECRTIVVTGYCYSALGNEERALSCYEAGMALAKEAGVSGDERALYSVLGGAYQNLGRHQQALEYLEKSRDMAREAGDESWEAGSLAGLGRCYYALGQYPRALEQYEQALPIYIRLHEHNGNAGALRGMGTCWFALGDTARALDYYEQCIELAHAVDDLRYESFAMWDVAECLFDLGQGDRAIAAYQQAVVLIQRSGVLGEECEALEQLASCYNDLGHYEEAVQTCEKAIRIARNGHDRRAEAIGVSHLGDIHLFAGRARQAFTAYEQALGQFKALGDQTWQMTSLKDLGESCADLEELDRTRSYYQQALALCRQNQNHRQEAVCLNNLGFFAEAQGDTTYAIQCYQEAFQIQQRLDDREEYANSLDNLGCCVLSTGRVAEALDAFTRALGTARESGNHIKECTLLNRLGYYYRLTGQTELAIEHCLSGLEIARRANVRKEQSFALRILGLCRQDQGDPAGSIKACEDALIPVQGFHKNQKAIRNAYRWLAHMRLCAGDISGARAAIESALQLNQPDHYGDFSVTLGIILLRAGENSRAQDTLVRAITLIQKRLARTPELYEDWDMHGLALCGLALCGQQDRLPDAVESFRKARQAALMSGSRSTTLHLFDALAVLDKDGILAEARRTAAGE